MSSTFKLQIKAEVQLQLQVQSLILWILLEVKDAASTSGQDDGSSQHNCSNRKVQNNPESPPNMMFLVATSRQKSTTATASPVTNTVDTTGSQGCCINVKFCREVATKN
jgi:hypothetical protein